MSDPSQTRASRRAGRRRQRRTALFVVFSLVLGLVGGTGVTTGGVPEAAAAAPGLIGRWAFDAGSGTTATDSVGGKTLTLGAGAGWAATSIQGASALTANGTSTGTAVTSATVLNTSSSFTVAAYVKLNTLSGYQTIVSQDGAVGSGFYFGLRGDNGRLSFARLASDTTNAASTVAAAGSAPVVGQWYHLAGVYNSTANTMALYLNGRLQSSVTAPTAWSATGNLAVGRGKFNSGNVDPFNGTVDDIRVYNQALSASDISHLGEAAHWNLDEGTGTTAADDSLSSFTGTLTNGPTWTTGVVGASALGFDGSDDYVITAAPVLVDTSKSFSVSAWARADGSVNNYNAVAVQEGVNTSGFYLQLAQGNWLFNRPTNDAVSPTSYVNSASTAPAVAGSWYHLLGVYNSVAQTLTLYVNGVKQPSVSYTTGWKSTGNLVVGRAKTGGTNGAYWNGAIDDVRTFPYVIDDAQATALYGAPAPPVPATPTATISGSTVTVSWVAPAPIAGSPTTGYVITPYTNGVAGNPFSTTGAGTSQNFTGATAGNTYRYTVAAVNAAGTSGPSAQSNAVTPATAPSAPAAPTATAGSLSASVSWTAPANNGSAITGYVVTPYVGTTAGTAQTFNSTATTQTLTGLTAGTAYTFKVAAINAVGTGAQSPASNAVTPNANPTIVVATPTAGQVGVAYTYTFTRTGGTTPFTWSVSAGTLPGGLSLAASTGVLSGTPTTAGTYSFTVKVTDTSGATDTEAVTLLVTDKPATPAAPTATAGLTSVVLSWVAPSSNGSTITGYVITPYKDGVAQTAITVDPSAKTRTLNGLTAGSVYSFTIAAVNAKGTSAASAVSNSVTPYAALNEPAVTSVTAGSTSARLTWTAPTSTGGSAITGYVVTPYVGGVAQTPQTFASTATTQTVTGLTAGTAYTFTVAATNASGTNVLYRINAGGPQLSAIDGGPDWQADDVNGAATVYHTYSNRSTWGAIGSVDSTVPASTPLGIYSSERWDPTDDPEMAWTFPVASGVPVKVRLYFGNQYSGTTTVGSRLFDVSLEGSMVLPNFDVVAAAGGTGIGTMREFAITSDGAVNLDFARRADTPNINAIEIIQTGTATTGPPSTASSAVTPNASPTLTFAAPPAAPLGVAYSQQLPVEGGTAPFTWSVSAGTLPAGITLSSGGLLSGTPTALGTYSFTVQVSDASGQTATRAVSLVVNDKPATPAAPTLTVSGTTATTTWVAPAANGSPITGYSIRVYQDGNLAYTLPTGTSTTFTSPGLTAGSVYTVTVAAVNAVGTSAYSAVSNSAVAYAVPNAPVITSATAADSAANLTWTAPSANGSPITGYVVTPYIGGVAQATQSFSGSTTTATITGLTPGTAYTFTVAAQNVAGTGPISAASTTVTPNASPTLAFAAPPTGEVNVPYSRQLTVTGGTAPFTWSVASGTLPAGVTLTSAGLLTGTPTTPGTYDFTVKVVDASGQSASKAVSLAINAQPVVTFAPAAGQVNVAYSSQPTVAGGVGPFTWAISAGSLPAGLTISSTTGAISGTPTASGSFALTVRATDAYNQVATRAVTLVVAAAPTLTSTPPPARAGVGYSFTFTATGGTGPFSYAVVAGSLPSGMTLSPAGVLSGTSRVIGTTSFTVRATDANGQTANDPVTFTVDQAPIQLVKTANVTSVAPGGTVTFTLTATNVSTTDYDGVHFYDPLADVLDDATYNGNATVTSGTIGYTNSTLDWRVLLAAGATASMTYTVVVANPNTGNKVLSGLVQGAFASTNCAPGYETSSCNKTVTVSGLTIAKTASSPTTTPGSTVTFTIVATNSGRTAYTGASLTDALTDVLDDATYSGDAAATAGGITYASSTLTWTGNLAVGASVTITYTVTVNNPDAGNKILTGTVVSSAAGSTCPSANPAASCTATVTVLTPALVITNTADVSTTTPGSTVPYTITLANTGQTAYTATSVTVALAAVLDDATYAGDATASTGSVVYNGGPGTLVWTGDIAIGATVTITASVTVRSPDPADLVLTSVVSSAAPGSTCPSGSANTACTSSVQVLVPALTITKSAGVSSTTPGSIVTYTVLVTNTGQTPYPAASYRDDLTGVLDDAIYNNNAAATVGTVSYAAPNLTWTGNLAVGASASISYTVTVNNPDAGNRSLTSTVVSTTPGNNCTAGGSDSRCSSTIAVLLPGLTLSATADSATARPGSVVRFTFNVTNSGQTTYTGTALKLDVAGVTDDATHNNDIAVSTGGLQVNPDGSIGWVLTLAPGASATGTGSFTVKSSGFGDKLLVARIVSDVAGSTCPNSATGAPCRTAVPVLIPGLTITKTANTPTVVPGGTVGYTIVVANTGETGYPAATFSDSLAGVLTDATYAGGATASSGTVSYAGSTLSWTGALAPGASATIAYTVTVRDPDPGDKLMTNRVVSTSEASNCPSGGSDARCAANVFVRVPELTIVKTASTATTAPGAVVGYTIAVTNSGQTSYPAANFADWLDGVLDDATYNDDVAATSGSASVSSNILGWTGALAAGESATITYSVTVRAADVGDDLLTNTLTSTSTGNNCRSGSADARCQVVVPVARLVIRQLYDGTTTTPGSVLTLSATFTNTGQVPYTGISIYSPGADTLDDGIPAGNQSATSGSLSADPDNITWTGSIPVGGVVTVSGGFTVKNPDPGNQVLTTTWISTAPGNNCPPNGTDPRCTTRLDVLTPGLTITKTASTTAVAPGGTVGYTITVRNTGQTAYTSAVVNDPLTGLLDDASYNNDALATAGTPTYQSSTLSWTGDLAVGATVVITYSVTTFSPAPGDKTMVNVVSSGATGSTCPPASGAAACRATVVVLTPALTIVKTADRSNATLGTTVTYTVAVRNSGQTQQAATFTDSLAGVLDDASYDPTATTATGGSLSYAGGVLSWSGSLVPGATATITYTVSINNPATGDRDMANTVVSSTAGNNCPTGGSDARCTATVAITNSVTLTFAKTADVVSTVLGGSVVYTVRVTNASGLPIVASYTDPLAGILDDATYNADASASSGTVASPGTNLTWTGIVAAHSTVTVTYSVDVNPTVTGDQILSGTVSSSSLQGSNNCLEGSADPRCTNTVTVAGLLLEQHYTETSTTPGSLIHLTATFTNTGQTAYNGITILSPSDDTVDDATPTGDQSATSGVLVLSATAITWTGNIPVGGTVTITGTLTVDNPDPGNKVIQGTLVSTAPGSNCPDGGSDTRCTARLNVLIPELTVTKTADVPFATPGAVVGYTITVHNTGQTAYVGAAVSDSLVGVLDDAAYAGGATASSGTLSFSSPTLSWSGDLAVDQTVIISFSVTVNSLDAGDKIMVNRARSTTVGSTCPPASGNPACAATVPVLTPALTITSAADKTTAAPGDTVTYTLVATNTGQTFYPSATFSASVADVTDDAVYTVNATATTGSVSLTGSTLTWTGALAPGDRASISYTVTVREPVPGNHRLAQTLISTTTGTNCPAGGSDPRCSTSVPLASLFISAGSDHTVAKPTDVVRFVNTFTNTGQVPYVGISVTTDVLGASDDGNYNGDAVASAGTIAVTPGARIVWTGDLAVGASVTINASLTVKNPDPGNKVLSATLTSNTPGSNCRTGSSDPNCRTGVPVLTPVLAISKTADTTTSTPGGTVNYTITVHNTGDYAYPGAVVEDFLGGVTRNNDDAQYSGTPTATSGAVLFTNPGLRWTGDLAIDQTVLIHYSVLVDSPDLGDKSIVNIVSSDELGSTCPSGSANASCTTTVTVLVPALDIDVAADRTTTTPGSTVTYTVTVHNTGQTPYAGASVAVALAGVLDDAGYAGGATSTLGGSFTFAEGALTWTGDLAVDATATLSYTVTVNNPVTGDRQLNTYVTSAAAGSTCSTATDCVNTVQVLVPGLSVSTSANVATATPGDVVTYTITLANTGQTPYSNLTATSVLTGVLDDSTLNSSIRSTIGVASYVAPSLTWTGNLPVGATAVITYSVTVKSPDPANKRLTNTVVANAAGSSCPTGSTNASCTTSVTVLVPALTIVKSASAPTVTPGDTITYTINLTNSGETAYAGASVNDSLAGVLTDATYNADAGVTGGGVLSYADPSLTWTGNLLVGASATITYSVTVKNPDPGDKHITNRVTSTAPGSTCPPGNSVPACTTAVTVLVPALSITKTADRATVTAGGAVSYTIAVTNTGQTAYAPATFVDPLAGVLDDADYAGDAVASIGTVSVADGTLAWTGPLAIGETATITYSVLTRFPADGDHTLVNPVVSTSPGSTCTTGDDDPDCRTSVSVLVPALTITKTADRSAVVAGDQVSYTITAVNTGEADYPAASLTDSLAGLLGHAAYNNDATASRGTVAYADGTLTWDGPLPKTQTVSLTFSVTVPAADSGGVALTNRVESSVVGSTCLPNSVNAGCTTSTEISEGTIGLEELTSSFTLTGLPGSTQRLDGAVGMRVVTNSFGGYVVTVQGTESALQPQTPGNLDTILLNLLSVRESGTDDFIPLSDTAPLVVHRQATASSDSGDAVSNDYQVQIPFVSSDTYETTLEYVVTAQ